MIPSNWKEHADRERQKVTVCIAATCDINTDDPKLILCSDWQIMSELGSAQTAFKQSLLGRGWYGLYAGSPHSAHAIIRNIFLNFINHSGAIDETNALALVRRALNDRKRTLCDEYTQGKFAMSYDHFLKNGKIELPDERFKSAVYAIENLLLGAELLVTGYTGSFRYYGANATRQ